MLFFSPDIFCPYGYFFCNIIESNKHSNFKLFEEQIFMEPISKGFLEDMVCEQRSFFTESWHNMIVISGLCPTSLCREQGFCIILWVLEGVASTI